MTYDVYGVGNALVDIQTTLSEELLGKIGFTKGVMTLVDEATQKHVLDAVASQQLHRCAGGSAANTIVGIAEFGGRVAYAGKVGRDELGQFWLEDMRKLGVTIEVPQTAGQSGACVVLITDDAQRTMLTHLGVSSTLGPDDIDEREIARSKYVYIEGYLFAGDSTKQAALAAIELAKENGTKVAFTVSDPFLIGLFRDEFLSIIENSVDLLFCNIEEARALTRLSDPVDCAQKLHHMAADVALTLGGEGSLILQGGQLIPIEPAPVKALDTTGAGDMYAAGILYGITNGLSWRQAGHLASHAAARVVGQFGARLTRKFTKEEIRQIIQ